MKTVIGRLGENAAETDLQHSWIPKGQGGRGERIKKRKLSDAEGRSEKQKP